MLASTKWFKIGIMKKIYIAGKVTGLPIEDVRLKFAAAQKEIEKQGFIAVNPMLIVKNPDTPWDKAMKMCIAELLKCDAALFLKDWSLSKGAILEHKIASDVGIRTLIGTRELQKRV